jgi:hypothetical protein
VIDPAIVWQILDVHFNQLQGRAIKNFRRSQRQDAALQCNVNHAKQQSASLSEATPQQRKREPDDFYDREDDFDEREQAHGDLRSYRLRRIGQAPTPAAELD